MVARIKKSFQIFLLVLLTASIVALSGCDTGSNSSTVKPSVNDYSWAELAAIAKEISSMPDLNSALKVAENYNLCSAGGSLVEEPSKLLVLSDGSQLEVRIAGFYHDDLESSPNKAGITFMFCNGLSAQPMNDETTNDAGWEGSKLRSWLNKDGLRMLPEELQDVMQPVKKLTNNKGQTEDAAEVTETSDVLWLFSSVELCGPIQGWYGDAADQILSTEGSQYKLFGDAGLNASTTAKAADVVLVTDYDGQPCFWWQRSADPVTSTSFNAVNEEGLAFNDYVANEPLAVIAGFCL